MSSRAKTQLKPSMVVFARMFDVAVLLAVPKKLKITNIFVVDVVVLTNLGGLAVLGGENVPPPLDEIGLTDLPKTGGAPPPPRLQQPC